MTNLPDTRHLMMFVAQQMVPQVQAAFKARFDKQIDVTAHKVMDPGDDKPRLEFRFTPSRPGLLPTTTERAWFDAYVDGYKRCHLLACDVLIAAPGDAPTN